MKMSSRWPGGAMDRYLVDFLALQAEQKLAAKHFAPLLMFPAIEAVVIIEANVKGYRLYRSPDRPVKL